MSLPHSRRQFLSNGLQLVGGMIVLQGRVIPAIAAPDVSEQALQNWARSFTYGASQVLAPSTEDEVCRLIRRANRFKALGSRHCFSTVADTDEVLISTSKLNRVLALRDYGDRKTVVVQPGIQYSKLGDWLQARGLALENYASLPHISVAGALATATHGSGTKNLAAAVVSIKLIDGEGRVRCLTRGQNDFSGAVVGVGALGFITEIELEVVPTYTVRQEVYLHMTWEDLLSNFDDIMAGKSSPFGVYSPSIFLHWQEEDVSEVWYKMRFQDAREPYAPMMELFGAKRAERDVHPVLALSPENCTPQLGVPGLSHERLPHFRPEFAPASGQEVHTEMFVPWKHAVDAINAVRPLANTIGPLLYITELRSIACDDLWLSTAYGASEGKMLSLQFSWKFDEIVTLERVISVLPEIQRALQPFGARPHWGKLFTWDASYLRTVYPKFEDFVELVHRCDPNGRLCNEFLRRNIYGA